MFDRNNHPKETFFFRICDKVDDDLAKSLQDFVDEEIEGHDWVIAPPNFVDEIDVPDNVLDLPIRLVGYTLEVYLAIHPWEKRIPTDVDRQHFNEVKMLIQICERFSKKTGVEFSIELERTQIGWIEDGVSDDEIRETLLDEWDRNLLIKESVGKGGV